MTTVSSFAYDPDTVIVGSALRRALPHLLAERILAYDARRTASIETGRLVTESVRYTSAFVAWKHADFHVIELADSMAHLSNANLLRSAYFRKSVKTIVYAVVPTHEAAAHLVTYVRSLGILHERVDSRRPAGERGTV